MSRVVSIVMQKTYISQLLESYYEILEPYLDVLSHSYFRSVPLVRDRERQKKDFASVTLVFGVFGLPLHWAFLRLPFAFRKRAGAGT